MKKYKKLPSVGLVMTPFPYFVEAADTAVNIEQLMDKHDIRHIPVQRNGKVIGIVSERDLHQRVSRSTPDAVKAQIQAHEVMVSDPYVVPFDAPLNEVASEMGSRRIGSAIVLRHGKLVGILSVTDVCRILADILSSEFPPTTRGDAA
jgi:CBS domain-containing protein